MKPCSNGAVLNTFGTRQANINYAKRRRNALIKPILCASICAEQMKPLAEGFISLIKMLIAPIIFFTVVGGIASVGDLSKVGRVGLKALIYFEIVTTMAMLLALGAAHLLKPGVGVDYKPSAIEMKKLTTYSEAAGHQSGVDFVLHVIPTTFVSAFTGGEILQVLLVSLLMGVALARLGERAAPLLRRPA